MGDRANVVIHEGPGKEIFLYTHWMGEHLPGIVQKAMTRGKGRWDDSSYLARIVFSEMIRNDIDGETGYGISTELGDNEYPLIVLDCNKQEVRFETEDRKTILKAYPFSQATRLHKYPKTKT